MLESTNLNERAYSEIKKCIISRQLAPGQRIIDSQLAETFGISRTPIRDAIRQLTEEGLLEKRSARGFYVFRPTLKDVDEIFEISQMIEMTAARKIIKELNGRNFAAMEEKLNTLQELAVDISSVETDEAFKRYLIELGDNSRLVDVYKKNLIQRRLIADVIFFNRTDGAEFEARIERSRMVHNKIVFGIRQRDIVLTAEAIAEHAKLGIIDAEAYVKQLDSAEEV